MTRASDPRIISVRSLKFDGTVKRSWPAVLIGETDERISVRGEFEQTVCHPDLGTIVAGTVSFEYFWFDRWYSVFEFFDPNGRFRNAYFNINCPPEFDGKILTYVDLDVDVVVWPGGEHKVLDEAEFAAHSITYRYPDEVIGSARNALRLVLAIADTQTFPHFTASTQQNRP